MIPKWWYTNTYVVKIMIHRESTSQNRHNKITSLWTLRAVNDRLLTYASQTKRDTTKRYGSLCLFFFVFQMMMKMQMTVFSSINAKLSSVFLFVCSAALLENRFDVLIFFLQFYNRTLSYIPLLKHMWTKYSLIKSIFNFG